MQVRGSIRAPLAALVALVATTACGVESETRDRGRTPPAAQKTTAPLSRRGSGDTAGNLSAPRIVIMGDSLTAGLGLSFEEAYPALLQERLAAQSLAYQVINAGISGDTSAGGLARLDWALAGNVRILVLALGANDALRGLPPEQMKRNLAAIIERAQRRDIAVILAGMEAPPNWGGQYVKAFHDVFPSLARQYQVSLVPFLLARVAGIEGLNQRDGIHPTAEGDRIIADTVWKVLQPVAEQQASRKPSPAKP